MNKKKDTAIIRNINSKIHDYLFRKDVWINNFGKVYEIKCPTSWCENIINPFEFNMGFRKPLTLRESKLMEKEKLIPLCRRCACSMNNKMTFIEWNKKYQMGAKVSIPRVSGQEISFLGSKFFEAEGSKGTKFIELRNRVSQEDFKYHIESMKNIPEKRKSLSEPSVSLTPSGNSVSLKPLIPTINILPDELEQKVPNINIYKCKNHQNDKIYKEQKKSGLTSLVKLFKIF